MLTKRISLILTVVLWFGVCTDDDDTTAAGAEGDSAAAGSSAGSQDKSAPPVPVHNPCKYMVANSAHPFQYSVPYLAEICPTIRRTQMFRVWIEKWKKIQNFRQWSTYMLPTCLKI